MSFKNFLRNPLISGSAVMFVGSLMGNVFNFLFNLVMSRNLTVTDYGILISLIALTTFPGIIFNSLVPTTVNFAASYFANNQLNKAKGLYLKIGKFMVISGVIILIIFSILSGFIADFMKIENGQMLVVLSGLIVFFSIMMFVNMAFLQAKLAFVSASFLTFLGGFLKFIFGFLLVLLGFSVGGVLVGLVLTGIVGYIISFLPLRSLLNKKIKNSYTDMKEIFNYAWPATIAIFAMTSLVTSDILLVKHFFSPHDAGLYAGLSLIGKVIFYFSSPIGAVMFPLVVKKHSLGLAKGRMLLASLGLVLIPSIALTLFYFLFPEFTIRFFLKNKDYLEISGYLGLFALYMTIYSIISILINFYLSIKKTKIYLPLMLAAILQVVLITVFHSKLIDIIVISLFISAILLSSLVVIYFQSDLIKNEIIKNKK